jgi:membrane-bound serine protease (ClpP class)
MSTPIAAMAPGTDVGAATPTGLSGATGSQSAIQDGAAYMETLAQRQGRNVAVAGSFVTQDVSITAQQALDNQVVDFIAPSEAQLLSDVDGRQVTLAGRSTVTLHTAGAAIEVRDLSGLIGFLHGLLDPTVAFIFFWLGLALIVIELLFPGHIVSGVLGVILLICAFMTFGLLPVRLVGIVLLLASAVALIVEARHPGVGIWGVLGLVFLVLGGWFLYERSGGAGVPVWVIGAMALFIAFFFGVVVVKARKLRDLPPPEGPRAVVGLEGVALGSGLNPSGVVRVAAEEWRATSTTGPIPGGNRIKVIGLDGLVLTVESAVDSHAPAGQAPAVPRPDIGEATR